MTNVSKQFEVNNNVKEIITEIIYHNCYVSYDIILTILLERYDVISFEQLQCGSIMEIQSLNLLFELNKKVNIRNNFLYTMRLFDDIYNNVIDDEDDEDDDEAW